MQPLSTSLSFSLWSLCVERQRLTFVDACAHLCSCGSHFLLSLPVPPDAPGYPLGTISPSSHPLAGFRHLCLAWKTSQVLLFLLCRNDLCDLLELYLFLLLTRSWAPDVPWAAGSQHCIFLPVFSCAVPSRGSSQQYLSLATANQPCPTPSPVKQVNRSSNSLLWSDLRDCSLPYTRKII